MAEIRPYYAAGEPLEAFVEADATIKNNTLGASSAENMVVPARSTLVLLSSDQDVWYSLTGTAAVPTDDSTSHCYLPGGTLDHPVAIDIANTANISLLSASSVCHVVGKFFE